ncbi:hypothetical protein E0L21_23815 [Kosakonia quasisacchari]|uniref:Uncharacterized protein n=1 Tax=Kosakonia quasisacchari TaxID=2529380 RepID=A0A4V2LWI9_9ENTR|nr:hypothetical protein [Kosakonia quasisacchari]TCB96655.1 hypothetical protein E0L21_23815 [Kosakonia quasisacchari]
MLSIRELNLEEIAMVSGGNANSNYEGGSSRGGSSNRSGSSHSSGKDIYSGVDSCGAGIFGGLVAGSLGGPAGMALGIVGGMIGGQCTKDSFSSKGGNGNKDKSNDFAGQCHW